MKDFIPIYAEGRDGLIRTALAVPEDKLTWRPTETGRTVLELLNNASVMTTSIRKLMESKGEFTPSMTFMGELQADREGWTREQYISCLQEDGDALLAALNDLTPEELNQPVTVTLLKEFTQPLGTWPMRAYRTWISRFGQINYIQMLYGDMEKH